MCVKIDNSDKVKDVNFFIIEKFILELIFKLSFVEEMVKCIVDNVFKFFLLVFYFKSLEL